MVANNNSYKCHEILNFRHNGSLKRIDHTCRTTRFVFYKFLWQQNISCCCITNCILDSDILQLNSSLCYWSSLQCLLPGINHSYAPRVCPLFGNTRYLFYVISKVSHFNTSHWTLLSVCIVLTLFISNVPHIAYILRAQETNQYCHANRDSDFAVQLEAFMEHWVWNGLQWHICPSKKTVLSRINSSQDRVPINTTRFMRDASRLHTTYKIYARKIYICARNWNTALVCS